jgi:hypothetical protein
MQNPRPHLENFRAPRAIFWTALALRLACILIGHTYRIRVDQQHFNFGFEAGRIARSLVTGHGYANPFNGISGPTAWLPPLYPLFIALAFKLFGIYTNSAALFLLACNSLFSAAIAPAIYELAARSFDAQGIARRTSKHAAPVALWAAWLWAVYPAALQYAIHWIWEMSLSTCLFTWTLVLALRLRHIGEPKLETHSLTSSPQPIPKPHHDLLLWASFGVLWGLVALSNASLLLVLPATILWILWPTLKQTPLKLRTLKPGITGAALTTVLFFITLAPWIIRNEAALHAFIPTRDNFGVELYKSTLAETGSLPWGTSLPLWTGDPEFQSFVKMGEVGYSQAKAAQAKATIHAHPGIFAKRTLDRFLFFWDGTPHSPEPHPSQEYLRQLSYSFLSLCGLLGLALALKRHIPAVALFAFAFLLIPLPYYLVSVQPRFRHPLEPLIAILAVYLFRSTQPRAGTQRKASQ